MLPLDQATCPKCEVGTMPPMVPMPIRTVGQRFKFLIALMSIRKWVMTEDWVVDVPLQNSNATSKVVIPKGFVHDGASIPPLAGAVLSAVAIYYVQNPFALMLALFVIHRFIKFIMSSIGLSLLPGIVHDYVFRYHYLQCVDGTKIYEGCTLWQADDLFRRLHIKVNDMPAIAMITYAGLRLGSWMPWKAARKRISK